MADRADQAFPTKCYKCESRLSTPIVCTGCQTLYPMPEAMDYFDLFQLPRRYTLNGDELEQRFLALSRNIHPDFFTGQSDAMRALSVGLTAELNEGYRVLRDPVLRAGYLLEQVGGPSAAADRKVPREVLAEVMMFREELEEAGDPDELNALRERVQRRRRETLDRIAPAADRVESLSGEERSALRQLLNSIRYYDNLLNEMPSGV